MAASAIMAIAATGRTLAGDKGSSHATGHPKPQNATAGQEAALEAKLPRKPLSCVVYQRPRCPECGGLDLQLMFNAINGVTAMTKAQWVITIRDNGSDVPATVRLRRLLKALLRVYGLRCTDIREPVEPVEMTPHPRLGDK